MITMLLGGLWHGAGWTFVVWGGLHGLGLVANHGWRRVTGRDRPATWFGRALAIVACFLFVTVAWVFFRAGSLGSALDLVAGMAGLNGVVLPATYAGHLGPLADTLAGWGVRFEEVWLYQGRAQVLWLGGLLAVCWLLPNTLDWARYEPDLHAAPLRPAGAWRLAWRPSVAWALSLSGLAIVSLVFMSRTGEFLYFQF